MRETLIRGGHVLTMDDELGSLPVGDVLIRGDRIAAVGRRLDAADAEVIDASGRIVMPGLVDAHRHMFSGLLRATCLDTTYTGNSGGYFEIVIRRFGGSFTPEDTFLSSELGAAESLFGGITTLHAWEHNMISPEHARASAEAIHASGIRARFSYGPPNDTMTLDQAGVIALRDAMFPDRREGGWFTAGGRMHLGVATRGVELGRPEIWEPEFAFARREGLPLTAHLMKGQIPELRARAALGPDVLVIHALEASDEDIAHLRDCGASVCVATPALARAGLRPSPVVRLMRAGVPVCLSVDSTSGCDTADMFAVMRITMIVERMLHADSGVYTARQVLEQATIGGARALGLGDVTGSLTPGKFADLIVIDAQALNLAPLTVAESLAAVAAQPANVEWVFVAGRCLKRAGELVGVDRRALAARANLALRQLETRVGRAVE